jgi:hypothetical protein
VAGNTDPLPTTVAGNTDPLPTSRPAAAITIARSPVCVVTAGRQRRPVGLVEDARLGAGAWAPAMGDPAEQPALQPDVAMIAP